MDLKKQILLVEDDLLIAMLEKKQLENLGYKIVHAIDGETSINIISENIEHIDLILMDIDLGYGIDGTIAAKEILKIRDIPIIFLSSHTEKEIVEKTEQITSYGYVVKNSGLVVLDASIKMAFRLFESKIKEHETNILLSSFIKNSPIYAYIKEISENESKVIQASDNFVNMIGIPGEKMIGKNMYELFPPDLAKKMTEDDLDVVFNNKVIKLDENFNGNYYNTLKFPLKSQNKRWLAGYTIDITDIKKVQNAINIQYSLLVKLNSCNDIIEALNIILNTILEIESFECGGIYLTNGEDKSLKLFVHHGLSKEFIDNNSFVSLDSNSAQFLSKGKPYYLDYEDFKSKYDYFFKEKENVKDSISTLDYKNLKSYDSLLKENIKSYASIPILDNGKLIAVINLASRSLETISNDIRNLLEAITIQVGNVLSRLKLDTTLKEHQNLIQSIGKCFNDSMIYQLEISPNGKRKFIYLSDMVEKLYGITAKEGLENPNLIYDKIYKEDYDRLILAENEAIKNLSVFNSEIRMIEPDGNIRWSSFLSIPKIMKNDSIIWDGIETVITERKKIEKELEDSKEYYKSLFKDHEIIKLLIDPENQTIVDANDFACKFYGYTYDELTSMKVSDINILPEEKIKEKIELAKRSKNFNFELQHRLANGEIRDVDVFSAPLHVKGKTYLHSIVYDITQRKRIEKENKESKEFFEIIFNINTDSILVSRLSDGLIVNINNSFISMFGFKKEDVIGKTTLEVNGWNNTNDRTIFVEKLLKNEVINNYEVILNKSDGTIFNALMSAKLFMYKDELHIFSFIRNISNYKLLEKNLLESNELFYNIFHKSPVTMILIIPFEGRFIDVNETFLRDMEYTREDVIGKTTTELNVFRDIKDREILIDILKKEGRVFAYECDFVSKTGKIITGLTSIVFIKMKDKIYQLTIVIDTTKQKEMSEKIKNLLKEKELLLRENNHRIKNNMNSIFYFLLLQSELQENEDCKKILNDAAIRMQNIMFLYDRLYNQSKNIIEQNAKEFLEPLIKEIIEVIKRNTLITTNIDIENIILKNKILSIIGIIINEFITNSIKHAFKDRDTGIISVSISKKDGLITIIYQDDGIGLPKDISFEEDKTFGLYFIGMLISQIQASISAKNDNGAKFIIQFKE